MKKLLFLFSLIIFACQSPTKISEKEVMDSFNSFFEVLDNDLDNFESMVTEDFFIFENSRRYSKEEFIQKLDDIDIDPSTKNLKDQVLIKIKDNGTGIPPELKDKIFQPFFTTKPTGKGTGLGLSLAYDIVTTGHGGAIELDTKQGEGTEFSIYIPIQKDQKNK